MVDFNFFSGFVGVIIGGALMYPLRPRIKRLHSLWTNRGKLTPVDKPKMVIIVRKDLELSSGKLAAQVGHAAVSCYAASLIHNKQVTEFWEAVGQPKIVVRSDKSGEQALHNLASKATENNIINVIITDAGRTEFRVPTVTVLGLGPAAADAIDSVSGHLKLY